MTWLPSHRQPLASGLSDYLYDPLALVLHIPGDKERFADGPRFGDEFHSHYLSLVHECAHWLQIHGTTYGGLLQLIAYSQGQNALGRLEAMSTRRRAQIVRQRLEHARPIVAGANAKHATPADLDDLRQNWREHDHVHRLLLNGRPFPASIAQQEAFAFVVGVCCVYLLGRMQWQPYPGDGWAAELFAYDSAVLRQVEAAAPGLTVRALLEGAATVQELLALKGLEQLKVFGRRHHASARSRLRATLFAARTGPYGRAFRIFCRTFGLSAAEAERTEVLRLFAFLIDVSLNPPVPPALLDERDRLKWADLYPPLRFLRLLGAVRRGDHLARKLGPETVQTLQTMLLERAGLPAFPTRVAIPWGDLDYDALAAAKPSNAKMIVMEHQRFRFWVQARCWRLREIYPWAFVSFDDVFLGGEGGQRWRYAPDAECRGWVLPPFRWAYKGTRAATLGIVHIDHDHGTDVIVSAAADTSHYELMAGRWPLRLAQYPRASRPQLAASVRATYAHRFSLPIFESW